MLLLILAAVVVFLGAGYMLKTLKNSQTLIQGGIPMNIVSSAYEDGKLIPSKYTCDGLNINPPLVISSIPTASRSLAIVFDDLDSPAGVFNHWLFWNVDPSTTNIIEDTPPNGVAGTNTFGSLKYGGPCPNAGTHRYVFTVYSLDISLDLKEGSNKAALENAMRGHILAQGSLMGTYTRSK